MSRLRRVLTPRGTLVIVGGTDRRLRALMLSPFVGQKLGAFVSTENHEDMIVLAELIESGKVTPVIDRTYPLSEAPRRSGIWKKDTSEEKVVITV